MPDNELQFIGHKQRIADDQFVAFLATQMIAARIANGDFREIDRLQYQIKDYMRIASLIYQEAKNIDEATNQGWRY